jgi:GntR family transcriptional regulator, rspAB operon transcriptional repressor
MPKIANSETDKAYTGIYTKIMNLEFQPGEMVSEIQLAKSLGLGRTPVREALMRLEQEGLIFTKQQRKYIYFLTIKEVEEIFDLKICIESAVVKWAALKGTPDQIQELKGLMDQMVSIASKFDSPDEEKLVRDWLKADAALHSFIFEMAGNHRAEKIVTQLNKQWHRLKLGIYTLEGRMNKSVQEHRAFVDSIVAKNVLEAGVHMERHLENLKKELIKLMKLFQFPK